MTRFSTILQLPKRDDARRAVAICSQEPSGVLIGAGEPGWIAEVEVKDPSFEDAKIADDEWINVSELPNHAWTGTGKITGPSSDFARFNLPPPDGKRCAVLQSTNHLEQRVKIPRHGEYVLTFKAAQRRDWRGHDQQQRIQPYLAGAALPLAVPPGRAWTGHGGSWHMPAGEHAIRFEGTVDGPHSALIDDVRLVRKPDPTETYQVELEPLPPPRVSTWRLTLTIGDDVPACTVLYTVHFREPYRQGFLSPEVAWGTFEHTPALP